ncbi:MAG: NAD(P)(+) transhydrogenase (Re/Si-specific) subunit alpha [Planctomycetes bacterium]|nr:NAD(P)(+) transhydrogenase (Re/Si-specific) subunit alpha [Planctomycetota bacterium]
MRVGVLREIAEGETRVAAVPSTVRRLVELDLQVAVQAGAGIQAGFDDDQYRQAGAAVDPSAETVLGGADLVLKVRPPRAEGPGGCDEVARLPAACTLIALLDPLRDPRPAARLAEAGVNSFSLDLLPPIARARAMDAAASMSSLGGYRAAVLATASLGRMIPMMMAPAGTFPAASALVVGAGVAGLQAVATLRRFGAAVTAADVRAAAAEHAASLGARAVVVAAPADQDDSFCRREQEYLLPYVRRADIVIAAARRPGRPAPVLITQTMVEAMGRGAVVVDLAVTDGGNCTFSRPDQRVVHQGVTILAPTNAAAQVPAHASMMIARHVLAFIEEWIAAEGLAGQTDSPILRAARVTHAGKVVHPAVLERMGKGGGP